MTYDPYPDDDDPLLDDTDAGWPSIEVYVTEPAVIGTLLGADGEPLTYILDRATIPIGFQPPDTTDPGRDRIRRNQAAWHNTETLDLDGT